MPTTTDLSRYLHPTPLERTVSLPAPGFWDPLMGGGPDDPDIAAVADGTPAERWHRGLDGQAELIALTAGRGTDRRQA